MERVCPKNMKEDKRGIWKAVPIKLYPAVSANGTKSPPPPPPPPTHHTHAQQTYRRANL